MNTRHLPLDTADSHPLAWPWHPYFVIFCCYECWGIRFADSCDMKNADDSHCGDGVRVSILIPNFNNGRASSKTGSRDFIGDLLCSLEKTLRDDPTSFEILVFDDGSTDDSITTLREWSGRKWEDGRPFLRLIEGSHCGILSVTANRLCAEAAGDIFVRLDGDIVCLTENWVSKIVEVFDSGPARLGVVGPKQLGVGFLIHSMGDFLLHPKGYHHVGFCLERYGIQHSVEVDHVMGCFYCFRREVFEEVGGFDEKMLRGQTIDFGLQARLRGWSCWAVADVEFIHAHSERVERPTTADSIAGVRDSLEYFEEKWGFSRIAPDLDVVRARYGGTPLVWNARWFDGVNAVNPKAVWARGWREPRRGIDVDHSEWGEFANNLSFREQVMLRARSVVDVIRQTEGVKRIGHLCCGCGLLGHIWSQQGLDYTGIDIHRGYVEAAEKICSGEEYGEGVRPRFLLMDDVRRLPIDDDSVDLFAITDQLERHPNPVGLLKEVRRVLKANGFLIIVMEKRVPSACDEREEAHWYTLSEMINQVKSVKGLVVVSKGETPMDQRPLMLAAQYFPDGVPRERLAAEVVGV